MDGEFISPETLVIKDDFMPGCNQEGCLFIGVGSFGVFKRTLLETAVAVRRLSINFLAFRIGGAYILPAFTAKATIMAQKKTSNQSDFPLGKTNFMILGIGVLMLICGFTLMAIPDHPDDPLTLTVAPILLVISFLVVIPYGIMKKSE